MNQQDDEDQQLANTGLADYARGLAREDSQLEYGANRNGPRPPGVSRKKWAEWKRRARGFRVHGVLLEPAGAAPYPSKEQPTPYGAHAVERQFRRAQRNQARIIASYGEPAE